MNIDEATQYIYNSLHSVYCDTCEYNREEYYGTDSCFCCNRKEMNWAIDRDYARKLAERILGGLK